MLRVSERLVQAIWNLRDKSQLPGDTLWVCLVFVGNTDVQMRTH